MIDSAVASLTHVPCRSVWQRTRTRRRNNSTYAVHEELQQIQAESRDEEIWSREHERQLFHWALEKARVDFKDATWEAFRASAIDGKSAQEIASDLDLSVGAVYIAKSRVLARIRQLIGTVEDLGAI